MITNEMRKLNLRTIHNEITSFLEKETRKEVKKIRYLNILKKENQKVIKVLVFFVKGKKGYNYSFPIN